MSLDVVALFAAHGAARDVETVRQLEHALQCAALARRKRADDEIVPAAPLDDVGHLVAPHRAPSWISSGHGAPRGVPRADRAMARPAIVAVLLGNRLT
jgi:predicted HD phosphohydrolase